MKAEQMEKLGFSPDRLDRIDTILSRYVEEEKIAGVHGVVSRHGETVYSKCFGHRDREVGQPIEPGTIYRIYSMSKPITSVAAMMLHEAGEFRLDDPVSEYIPCFKEMGVLKNMSDDGSMEIVPAESAITVWNLFTHTAGLSYGFDQNDPLDKLYQSRLRSTMREREDVTLEQMVELLATLPLGTNPGTVWRYSLATDVLGYLVQVISGMPFEKFLQERIFDPLGMTDTAFYVPQSKRNRFAVCYGPEEGGGLKRHSDDLGFRNYKELPKNPSGGGGLVSTAEDYLQFCRMLRNGGEMGGVRLLGRKSIELMILDHMCGKIPPRIEPPRGFGLGFSVLTNLASMHALGSLGTFGWGGAANTTFWIDPKEDLIGILMLQFMPANTYPVIPDFNTAVYQALV
jgi:CubicO group peptidase (beta-lactamase class C family)